MTHFWIYDNLPNMFLLIIMHQESKCDEFYLIRLIMYVVKNTLKCDLYHSQMLVLSKKNYLKNKIAFKKKNFIAFIIVKI